MNIRKLIFMASITLLPLALGGVLVGQDFPLHLADSELAYIFRVSAVIGLPLGILGLSTYTINPKWPNRKQQIAGIIHLFVAVLVTFIALGSSFRFCGWTNAKLLFQEKDNPDTQIIWQRMDCGALGYGGESRIVKVKPVLFLWKYTIEVDTAELDQEHWEWIDEEIGTPFP